MFVPYSLHTQNSLYKPSDLPTFSLQAVVRNAETTLSVHMSEDKSYESRHTILSRVKHCHVNTAINDILVSHSFGYQCNFFKSIIQHNISLEHFKFLCGNSSIFWNFRTNPFYDMENDTDILDLCITSKNLNIMLKCILFQQKI